MVEWIAVVAFCIGEQCAFWANTDKPYTSEAECRRNLVQAETYFRQQRASNLMSGCIPLKWTRV